MGGIERKPTLLSQQPFFLSPPFSAAAECGISSFYIAAGTKRREGLWRGEKKRNTAARETFTKLDHDQDEEFVISIRTAQCGKHDVL